MARHCKNCSAELFEGQQFCRRCGTPTGELAPGGEQPTQLFGAGSTPPGDPSTGEVSGGPQTNSVSARTTAHYVPPVVPSSPPPGTPPTAFAAPPPRRRSRRWLLAFTVIGIAGVAMLASLLAAIATRRSDVHTTVVKERAKREVKIVRNEHPEPPAPPEPGALPIDESDAEVSDDETVIERTYDLAGETTVVLKNINGPVSVEGWDEPRAEVKITKRGGNKELRRLVRLVGAQTPGRLSFQTLVAPGGPVEVAYEIRLPRKTAKLEITSVRSDVEVSDLAGAVSVDVKQGNIEMAEMSGPVRTNLVNGDTEVELKAVAPGAAPAPSVFKIVNGGFELRLPQGTNADLDAEVTNGKIEADEDLKLEQVSRPGSNRASGRVGKGGAPVSVKVVNGTIRIRD